MICYHKPAYCIKAEKFKKKILFDTIFFISVQCTRILENRPLFVQSFLSEKCNFYVIKRIVHELKIFRFVKIPSYKSNLL